MDLMTEQNFLTIFKLMEISIIIINCKNLNVACHIEKFHIFSKFLNVGKNMVISSFIMSYKTHFVRVKTGIPAYLDCLPPK